MLRFFLLFGERYQLSQRPTGEWDHLWFVQLQIAAQQPGRIEV
jgi:hypothetical protein